MKTIWKIAIPVDALTVSVTNTFELPKINKILHVREQNDSLCVWFEVDPDSSKARYSFQVFGTGTGPIGDHLNYLGTGIFADGDLVLHLYQVV